MNFEKYKNNLSLQVKSVRDCERCKSQCRDDHKHCNGCGAKLPHVDSDSGAKVIKDYNTESARLRALFKKDALSHVGLTGHECADRAFELVFSMFPESDRKAMVENLEVLSHVITGRLTTYQKGA